MESRIMSGPRLVQNQFRVEISWLILNLFSALGFGVIAIGEMSLRDYPEHDPFSYSILIDPLSDLFIPMIRDSIVIFGILSAILIFISTRSFWQKLSKVKIYLNAGTYFILTNLFFSIGIVLVNWNAENLECELIGGTLFGCWQFPDIQQWHVYVGILWTVGLLIIGYLLRKFVVQRN